MYNEELIEALKFKKEVDAGMTSQEKDLLRLLAKFNIIKTISSNRYNYDGNNKSSIHMANYYGNKINKAIEEYVNSEVNKCQHAFSFEIEKGDIEDDE